MAVAIIIDIVFIAVLVIFAVIGLYIGFTKSAVSMIGTFASLVLAILAAKPIASLIDKIFGASVFFSTKIANAFYGIDPYFEKIQEVAIDGAQVSDQVASLDGVSAPIRLIIKKTLNGQTIEAGESVGGVLGSIFGHLVTIAIAVIVGFILIRLILWLIQKLFAKLTEYKFIGALDKTLGFVLGAAKGFLYVAFVFIVISLLSYIPSVNTYVNDVCTESKISGKVYKWVDNLTQNFIADNMQGLVDSIRDRNEENNPDANSSFIINFDEKITTNNYNINNLIHQICLE